MDGQREPWPKRARTLILYCPQGQWRYAIYNDDGIVDGSLPDLSPAVDPQDAQAALLREVEEFTGLRYTATWREDEPRWWSAELDVPSG